MTIEHILQMGYYPDRFALHGLPPDTFFIHFESESFEDARREIRFLADDLRMACIDKYKLNLGGYTFDHQDCFWSCTTRVAELSHQCGLCERDCDKCECDEEPTCSDCEMER